MSQALCLVDHATRAGSFCCVPCERCLYRVLSSLFLHGCGIVLHSPSLCIVHFSFFLASGRLLMRTSQPSVTQVHRLRRLCHLHHRLRHKLHQAKPWIQALKPMKDPLHVAVQSYSNKRCILSYLGYTLILMRIIYCLNHVFLCYLGLHKRRQCQVTSRTLRATPRTPRRLLLRRMGYAPRPSVTQQLLQLPRQNCTISGRDGGHNIHG